MSVLLSGATISDDGRYRYRLWRIWDPARKPQVWLMLNPSTADAEVDDATIRKCCGFARRGGHGGIVVVNLFAYRSREPKELVRLLDPAGPDNNSALRKVATYASAIVCGWGNLPARALQYRVDEVKTQLGRASIPLLALGVTQAGQPWHPLMVSYKYTPQPYV